MKRFLFPVVLFMMSCSGIKNDPVAQRVYRDHQKFIVFIGKRALNAHDPTSIGKKYQDSFSILVPSFDNGTINGKDIPVRQGYYTYSGTVTIEDDKVKLDLASNNTDDHTTVPLSWNGTYKLQ